MRSAIATLCGLLLPTIIFSQDHVTAPVHEEKTSGTFAAGRFEFNFPGTVALRRETDSMTDKQFCVVSVASDLVGIDADGSGAAVLETPSDIDYDKPALLRIDSDPPIPLNVQRQNHSFLLRGTGTRQILIPAERTAEFVLALYTQRRMRLRYSVFPGPGRFDEEIKFGDFAAAYDRGVELCGFRKLRVAPVHPSAEALADLMFPLTESAEPPKSPVAPIEGWYLDAVQRRLAQNWLRSTISPGTAARCILAFLIAKDGSVSGISLSQSAGDASVDTSAQRAVLSSSPMPPLPSNFARAIVAMSAEFDVAAATVRVIPQPGP